MLKLFFSYPLRLEIEKNELTKKDKLINEELENWKHKFTNESMAHKNTNDEEKMARDEIKKVQVELQQKNYEIQQKNEKLEEMGNEKIKRSKYIEEMEKQLNYL
jgi:chromosome segregation ATPase